MAALQPKISRDLHDLLPSRYMLKLFRKCPCSSCLGVPCAHAQAVQEVVQEVHKLFRKFNTQGNSTMDPATPPPKTKGEKQSEVKQAKPMSYLVAVCGSESCFSVGPCQSCAETLLACGLCRDSHGWTNKVKPDKRHLCLGPGMT